MRLNFAKTPTTPRHGHCPVCGAACRILCVRKEGPNHGRRFVKCRACNPEDPAFYWLYTPEQKRAIRRDLSILLGDCDGACSRDDVGFNRKDSFRARIYFDHLEDGVDIDWGALAGMLRKYRNTQLGGHDDY